MLLTGNPVYEFEGHRYVAVEQGTIAEVRSAAEAIGGEIVSVNSQAEQDFITQTFQASGETFFIGLSDRANEGQFAWFDGSELTYTNWATGEPNNWSGNQYHGYSDGEDFVMMYGDGTWNDVSELACMRAIVEISDHDGCTDLIVNGSFEEGPVRYGSRFYQEADIPGWQLDSTSSSRRKAPRIQLLKYSGFASDGDTALELDSLRQIYDVVYQDISTTAGETYALSFDLRKRTHRYNHSDDVDNEVEVWWDGELLDVFSPDSRHSWNRVNVEVTAGNSGQTRLEFRERPSGSYGGGDGFGPLIDNVKLCAAGIVANTAPELSSIEDLTMDEGTQLQVQLSATDADAGQQLTYEIVGGPSDATIDANTGLILWTPTEADGPGQFDFSVRVRDNGQPSLTDTASFSVQVAEVNSAPILNPIDDATAEPDQELTITVSALDPDLPVQTLSYSILSGPNEATIDASTGELNWTPGHTTVGDVVFEIGVSDGQATDSQSFTVTVEPCVNLITNGSFEEGQLRHGNRFYREDQIPGWQLGGEDVYGNGPLKFQVFANHSNGASDGNAFLELDTLKRFYDVIYQDVPVVEGESYELSFDLRARTRYHWHHQDHHEHHQESNEVEVWWEGQQVGVFSPESNQSWTASTVTVQASQTGQARLEFRERRTGHYGGNDGLGPLLDNVKLCGNSNDSNVAPTLASIPDQTIDELSAWSLQLSASDANAGQSLTFSLTDAPAGATIDASTGLIQWTPSEQDGPADVGFSVSVSDGELTDEASFTVTVAEVNQAPVLASIEDQVVNEGEVFTITPSATDADLPANSLVYSLAAAPAGATIDAATGEVNWTPSETDGPGTFEFTIAVTDGELTAQESFTVTVAEVNQAPVLASIEDQNVNEGEVFTITPSATDADLPSNSLVYSLAAAPAGATIDTATGEVNWTPSETDGPGTFEFTIAVTDGELTDEASFTVTVAEVNQAPVLASIEDQNVNEGEAFTITPSATDADLPANSLVYSLATAPTGATIDTATGEVNWTPSETDGPGTFDFTIAVTDGELTAQESFTVTVAEVNQAPVLASIEDQNVNEGEVFTITPSTTDADLPSNSLVYSLAAAPAGATIDTATGEVNWTPSETDGPGSFEFTIAVTDGELTDEASFTVTVAEVNLAPTLSAIADMSIDFGEGIDVLPVAADLDLPANQLVFSLDQSPDDASIDPVTGRVTWSSTMGGTFDFVVRVADAGGLFDTEAFSVSVQADETCLFEPGDWTFTESGGGDHAGAGMLQGCDLVLTEGDSFEVAAAVSLIVPDTASHFVFNYSGLTFDGADGESISDAFEVALLDANRESLVHGIDEDRDAFFNVSESDQESSSASTVVDGNTIKVDLTHLTPGTVATLVFRLVNNDGDTGTVVTVKPIAIADGSLETPLGVSAQSDVEIDTEVDLESLSNVTSSIGVNYGTTSLNDASDTLFSDLTLTNNANHPLDGPLILVVSGLSLPTVVATGADGTTPDGDAYYVLNDTSGVGTLTPGESTLAETLRFYNPTGEQFGFELEVYAQPNQAPEFTSSPNTEGLAGVDYVYDANADDADEDVLAYALTSGPTDMSIDAATGVITWSPTAEDVGTHAVSIEVTDGRGGQDTQQYSIEVTASIANRPPVIISSPIVEGFLGSTYQYQVNAVDPDSDPIGYRLDQAPTGLSIHAETGLVSWNPTVEQLGTHTVKVTVDDGRGGTATQEYQIAVLADASNTAPVITSNAVEDFFVPGFSNPTSGNVTPQRISLDLGNGETFEGTVSITLPESAGRFADIVLAVDESGSMTGSQAWVADMIPLLDEALVDAGIGATAENPNRFAIIGGGRQQMVSYFLSQQPDTKYTLYGPSGQVAASGVINEVLPDELLNLELPEGGQYALVIEAQNVADLGNGIDVGVSGETGDTTRVEQLELNTLIDDEFLLPGQSVEYQFQLTTSSLLYFDAQNVDHYSTINWKIEGPYGEVANQSSIDVSDTSDLTPVINVGPGDYRLTLDSTFDTAVDFKFQLLNLLDATNVESGETVSGEFEQKVNTVAYQFTAQEGQLFQLVNSAIAHTGSKWRLVDSEGTVLLSQSLGVHAAGFELADGGEYFLLMEASLYPHEGSSQLQGPSTFEFTLDVSDPQPPTPISLGATVNGELEFRSDFETYAFSLADRSLIYVDSLVNSFLTWKLTGPRGVEVNNRYFSSTDSFNNSNPVLDLVAGEYTMRVDTSGTTGGPFAFRVIDLASVMEITPSTAFSGELTVPNETDLYRFDASAGDEFYFDVESVSDVTNTQYKLIDPFGQVVFISNRMNDQGSTSVPVDGTYTLLVEGWRGNVDADTYTMNVIPVVQREAALTLGTQVAGSLGAPAESVVYTFDLASDGLFYIDSLTNEADFEWSLEGPRGEEVASRQFTDSDPFGATAAAFRVLAGSYRLTVRGSGDTVGGFAFNAIDLLQDAQTTPITPAPGSTNPTVPLSDSIAANETQRYRFDAAAGDEFSFITTFMGSGNVSYRVVDAFGSEVLADTSLTTDRLNVHFVAGGTYYLLVEGRIANDAQSEFTFDINWIQNRGVTTFSGDALTFGSITHGNLATSGQIDQYTFTLTERSLLYLDALTNNSFVRWSLRGPAGQTVTNRSFANTDSFGNVSPVGDFAAGEYQLEISASSGTPGDYDFQLVNLASATAITLGTSFGGPLVPANETHFYSFSASADESLYFDVETVSDVSNTQYKLIDAFGQVVFISDRMKDTDRVTMERDGVYTLLVEGWYLNTGDDTYTMNVHRLLDSTAELTLGQLTNGTLTAPGERASYTFALSDWTQLHFDSQTDSGTLRWSLTGPRGIEVNSRLFNRSDSSSFSSSIVEVPAGEYTLTVDGAADALGDFRFALLDLADAPSIAVNTDVSGMLTNSSGMAAYQFDAQDGDIVFFDSLGHDANFSTSPYWRLVDPYGQQVFNRSFASDGGPMTLGGGTHTLLIEGHVSDSGVKGAFGFSVVLAGNELNPEAATPLTIGDVISTETSVAHATDRYAFTLASQSLIYFDSLTNDSSLTWQIERNGRTIVAPRAFSRSDSVSNPGVLNLRAGDYVMSVTSPEAEPYAFRLHDLAAATPIDLNTPFSGELTTPNETDTYTFSVDAGDQIYFDVVDTSSTSAYYRVIDERGSVVFTSTSTQDRDVFDFSVAGTYWLNVEGRVNQTVSQSYEMNLVRTSTTVSDLVVGELQSGTVANPGDVFEYQFSLSEDSTLAFDSQTNTSLIQWSLHGPAGEVVSNRSLNGSDSSGIGVSLLDLNHGDYTLTVDATGESLGDFAFRLLDLEAAIETNLGVSFSGELTNPTETDIYNFDATMGTELLVDVEAVSQVSAVNYSLFDPFGNLIVERTSLSNVEVVLNATGTYSLLVEGRVNNVNSNSYTINLREGTTRDGGSLSFGTEISDSIATPNENVTFTFNLTSDSLVHFDSLTSDADIQWSLEGPRGVEYSNIAFSLSDSTSTSNTSSPLVAFELRSGEYTLTVHAIEGYTGDFEFALFNLSDPSQSTLASNPVAGQPTTITGVQTTPNQTQAYRFDAVAGDRLSFDATTTGSIGSYYRLLDPHGREVFERFLTSDQAATEVSRSGTYFLLVEGQHTNAENDEYTLVITHEGNTPPVVLDGTALTFAAVTRGDLATTGQTDSYAFTLASRSLLYLDALTNSSTIRWTLTGPRGVEVTNRPFSGTDSFNNASPVLDLIAGDYQLDIFASSGTPGSYAFSMSDLNANAQVIVPGTEVSDGELTIPNETDLYRFVASEGERFYIDMSASDVNNTQYKLIDPFGQVVFISNRLNDQEVFAIPRDGQYTLLVEGWRGNSGADTYTLNVIPFVETSNTLNLNTSTAAEIQTPGERLTFDFELSDPQLLYFSPNVTTNQVTWALAEQDGFATDPRRYDLSGEFVELQTGTYTLTIDGTADYVGDVSFSAYSVGLSTSGLATDGTVASATIDNASPLQIYTFDGVAGDHFALRPDYHLAWNDSATSRLTAMDLVTNADGEDGHANIDYALRSNTFRDGAAVNVIMVSDEDRDYLNDDPNVESLFGDLSDRQGLLNVVVRGTFRDDNNAVAIGVDSEGIAYVADGSGGFVANPVGTVAGRDVSTQRDYIDLAFALDGAAWDLGQLRSGGVTAESFTNAFVDVKVSEILEQTSLQLLASNPNADFEIVSPATGSYEAITGGETYDFDIRIGNDGQPISYDLLFNQGQTVGSIPVFIVSPYQYGASAVDADGDALTWSITDGPDGLIIDASTGLLAWPGDSVLFGDHEVTIRVDDGRGGFDEQTFTLNVNGGDPASIRGRVFDLDTYVPTTVDVIVEGTSDPYLAGMPDGSTASGGDVAPDHSPVLVEGLDLASGQILTFAATGQVSYSGTPNPNETPDGKLSGVGQHSGTENGISNAVANFNSLVGVFLSDARPDTNEAPGTLDFINAGGVSGGINYTQLSPELQQIFFIGDGVTDDGAAQEITVPDGATRLFLGTWDGTGWYNNGGFLDVSVTGFSLGLPAVSEVIDSTSYSSLLNSPLDTVNEFVVEDFEDGTFDLVGVSLSAGAIQIPSSVTDSVDADDSAIDGSGIGGHSWLSSDGAAGITITFDEEVLGELPTQAGVVWTDGMGPISFQAFDADGNLIGELNSSIADGSDAGTTDEDTFFGARNSHGISSLFISNATGAIEIDHIQYSLADIENFPAISNTVYLDQNRNGLLDAGEQSTTTDADGRYAFENLDTGSYVVSLLPQDDWQQIVPSGNQSIDVSLDSGESKQGVHFGIRNVPSVNTDPEITSEPPTTIVAGESYEYQPTVRELDGDTVEFDLPLAPVGMAVSSENGTLRWTPRMDQIGIQNVLLRIRDGRGGYDLQYFQVNVQAPNTAPVITSTPPDGPAGVGLPVVYQVNAIDADADAITYALGDAPNAVTIDEVSGILNWTPGISDLGQQSITVIASDERGLVTEQTFELEVQIDPVNTGPTFLSDGPAEAHLGSPYIYLINVVDPNGDPVTLTLDTAPTGMSLSSDGLVEWVPSVDQIGDQLVRVTADDGRGGTTTQEYSVRVATQPVNNPPSITSPPITSAVVDVAYQFLPTAVDPNNDSLFWSLEEGPRGMTIDPSTGQIDWLPMIEDLGAHSVTVQVTDAHGAGVGIRYELTVRAVNTPPVILSSPPTEGAVGATYFYQIVGEDTDSDPLSFSLGMAPSGMSIHAQTGRIEWTPDVGQDGSHDVEVTVADALGASITQSFAIVVADGQPNQLPVITSGASLFATVGQAYDYDVEATDLDGDTLTYALLNGPAGMTIDAAIGLIQWTPTASDIGSVLVEIAVTDPSGGGSLQGFGLQVLATNNAPEISSTAPTDAVVPGGTFRYDLLATDADGDFLTYELITSPTGMVIDGLGRMFWRPDASQIGDNSVEVRVSDPRGASDTETFLINVEADTAAPEAVILLSANQVNIGEMVDIRVSAIDNVGVESIVLTVDGVVVPLDANAIARVEMNTVGSIVAEATVTDAAGNTTVEQVNILVSDPSDVDGPSVLITSPSVDGVITSLIDVVGTVADDTLVSYQLLLGDVQTRSFNVIASGTENVDDAVLGQVDPTLLQNGSYVLRLEAFDASGNGNFVEQEISIEGDLKLGDFKLGFTDMVVPVNGIDIVLSRTYDSLRADENGALGHGWNLDYRNVKLQVGVEEASDFDKSYGFYTPYRDGTKVYITLPGGERETFVFSPTPKGIGPLVYYLPTFTAAEGTTSRLTVSNATLANNGGEYAGFLGGLPYNPASPEYGSFFTLTTEDDLVYRIDADSGEISRITDQHGNRLDFTDSAVTSTTGISIEFERDAAGRVTAAIDPSGQRVEYDYNTAGDLVATRDREGNETQYVYDESLPHYLTEVVDPLGNSGIRSEYDSAGRLISVSDPNGNALSIATDLGANTQLTTDALGNTTLFTYDSRGNTVSEVNALNQTTVRSFDTSNNLLSETDGLGRTTAYTYDSFGNVLTLTDPNGNETTFTYADAQRGRIASMTDATGAVTTYTYDSRGNLISTSDTSGVSAELEFDNSGNLKELDNPISGATAFEYDSAGNLSSQTDALGNEVLLSYDASGNVVRRTWQQTLNGELETLVETYQYDANNNLIQSVNAAGNNVIFTYDANGRLLTETDELGRVTRYEYDARGLSTATIFADATPADLTDNPRVTFAYDELGRQTSATDELGRTTYTEYDAIGQVISRVYPDATPEDLSDNPRQSFEYDAAGQLVAEIDENGNRTEFEYDLAGRQVLVRDALGNETVTEYDTAGRPIKQIDALGQETQFEYDNAGRIKATITDDDVKTELVYNASGLLSAQLDRNGNSTLFEYDALGRLAKVTEANGSTTLHAYDEVGNLISTTDGNGHTTRFQYDALGRQISTERPSGVSDVSVYSAVGNLSSYTDFNGDEHTFEYDQRNRLVAESYDGSADVTYTYLANGLVSTEVDHRGTTTFAYDERNRLVSKSDPDSNAIGYAYDDAGNRTLVTSLGGSTSYTFDELNRLVTTTDSDGDATTNSYDAIGRLTGTAFANGTIETRTYGSQNRVTSIETKLSDSTISKFDYSYDANGNRTSVTNLDGSRVEYTFDGMNRLVSEDVFAVGTATPLKTTDYTYDLVGNRLTMVDSELGTTTNTHDVDDRLTTSVQGGITTTYGYDANGNQVSKSDGTTTTTYVWTGENLLESVDLTNDGTPDVEYEYDARDNRVSRTEGSVTTYWQVDDNRQYAQVVTEYTAGNTLVAEMVYGDRLISQDRNGEKAFYHADAIGSIRLLTNESGATVNTYEYDAFGNIVTETGTFENAYQFAGERRDATTGQDYLRARNYDPTTGRFTSTDTFAGSNQSPVTLHNYLYANANPTTFTDPTGLFSIAEVSFTSSTLADVQTDFAEAAITGLKRVARVADKILVPGRELQNVALHAIMTNAPDSQSAYDMYAIGTQLVSAGYQAIGVALSGIYIDTANSVASVGFSLKKGSVLERIFGPAKLELKLFSGQLSRGTGKNAKTTEFGIQINDLLKEYIDDTQKLLNLNDLSEYIVEGTGHFENGVIQFKKTTDKAKKQITKLTGK